MKTKQVIVMRTDLNMRKGKMAAQAAHAAMAFITRRLELSYVQSDSHTTDAYEASVLLSAKEVEWLDSSFTKVCVGIDSEEALLDIYKRADVEEIEAHIIQDNGTTEFGGVLTYTCLALGPDDADRIDELTAHLKLL